MNQTDQYNLAIIIYSSMTQRKFAVLGSNLCRVREFTPLDEHKYYGSTNDEEFSRGIEEEWKIDDEVRVIRFIPDLVFTNKILFTAYVSSIGNYGCQVWGRIFEAKFV
jgi:hypothetical protein